MARRWWWWKWCVLHLLISIPALILLLGIVLHALWDGYFLLHQVPIAQPDAPWLTFGVFWVRVTMVKGVSVGCSTPHKFTKRARLLRIIGCKGRVLKQSLGCCAGAARKRNRLRQGNGCWDPLGRCCNFRESKTLYHLLCILGEEAGVRYLRFSVGNQHFPSELRCLAHHSSCPAQLRKSPSILYPQFSLKNSKTISGSFPIPSSKALHS